MGVQGQPVLHSETLPQKKKEGICVQTFLHRRYVNGQKVCEKTSNIPGIKEMQIKALWETTSPLHTC
jgi:hypothetical protein